jgi:hypothetical protein
MCYFVIAFIYTISYRYISYIVIGLEQNIEVNTIKEEKKLSLERLNETEH